MQLCNQDWLCHARAKVPTWKPGTQPVLRASFTDLSHVGCKGNGHQLTFGEEGEVLKVDGGLVAFSELSVSELVNVIRKDIVDLLYVRIY